MSGCFLDTSALVKRYHVEDGTQTIDRIMGDPQQVLFISRLGFVELLSALATKVRMGHLVVDSMLAARKRFLGDIKCRRIVVVRVLVGHFHTAEQLIARHATTRRLRTLDALQLSIALDLQMQQ